MNKMAAWKIAPNNDRRFLYRGNPSLAADKYRTLGFLLTSHYLNFNLGIFILDPSENEFWLNF